MRSVCVICYGKARCRGVLVRVSLALLRLCFGVTLPLCFLVQLSQTQKRRARKKRQKEARTQAELDSGDYLNNLGEMFDLLEVRQKRGVALCSVV